MLDGNPSAKHSHNTGHKFDYQQLPMRRKLHQPVEEDPLSPITIAKVKGWIKECIEEHEFCFLENKSFIPTRLLNVKDGLFLQHTREDISEVVPYLALSHCWGHQTAERPMLKTTLATIEEKATEIPMSTYALLLA